MPAVTGKPDIVEIPVPDGRAGLKKGDTLTVEEPQAVSYKKC